MVTNDNSIPAATRWTLDATGEVGRAAISSVYMITCLTTGSKGSGFLLNNGFIVTNYHVIQGEISENNIVAISAKK